MVRIVRKPLPLSAQPWTPTANSAEVRLSLILRIWPKCLGKYILLDGLANGLYTRFKKRGESMVDLENALVVSHMALDLTPEGHPNRASLLGDIALYLSIRFMRCGMLCDVDEVLALAPDALNVRSGHPNQAYTFAHLARYIHTHFWRHGNLSDLEKAVSMQRNVLELCPEGDSDRALSLEKMAECLYSRFSQLGVLSDLDEALSLQRSALKLRPKEHPNQVISLSILATYLHGRFRQLGSLPDLDEALVLQRNALELLPKGHPQRAYSLRNLANYLYSRSHQYGTLSDLDEALLLQRQALDLLPKRDLHWTYSLGRIADYLHTRSELLGNLSDLDEALSLQREALELRPEGHPDRAFSLEGIATCLNARFTQLGVLSDLDEAFRLQRQALDLHPKGGPHRAYSLGTIATCLYNRFRSLGNIPDLDEALSLQREALELRPEGHPERAISLGGIANCLFTRFTQLGTLPDLDEALVLQRNALELRPEGHPGRATLFDNVAICLYTRFTQLGMLSDLEEALALQRRALELRPEGHPDRTYSLGGVTTCLYARFLRLGIFADLDEALSMQRQALELCGEGHIDRANSLSRTAHYLHARFTHVNDVSDLDEALALHRQALELRAEGCPDRAYSLSGIAICLDARYRYFGMLSDLDEAISLYRSALEYYPNGHPSRAFTLGYLASSLLTRFKQSNEHDMIWLQESFDAYAQLSNLPRAQSVTELEPVKEWIQAAEEYGHTTTVLAYQTFFRLCVHYFTTLPSLPQNLTQFKQLVNTLPIDAFAACARQGLLQNAIELLEQGRGVFWNQLLRLRSPLDDVIASGTTGKELAARFTQSASLLRAALDTSNTQPQHDRAWHLQIQLREIVADIRKLPGLDRFLDSPQLSDLREAASEGPVIIVNTSKYRSDAIIVLSDEPSVLVPLPITKAHVFELTSELRSILSRAKLGDVSKDMMVLLRAIWDLAVSSIVTALKKVCGRDSRIWWCPTAEFSLLPLHASGPYRKGEPNLSNLYISSYTPTLGALIRARRQGPDMTERRPRFLVVGQAQSPGQNKLGSVNTEVSTVSERVQGVADVTCIQDEDANIAQVSRSLSEHNFVHLACHGIPKRKRPFESGFALGDGRVEVEDIMGLQLQNGQFAYLSACHTTVGDEESPDEVIHLAAAMQFAGFRSVIGTMWAVDDAHANAITAKFYEYMLQESGQLDHTRAAWALHKTMRHVSKEIPFDQRVLYVHMGA